MPDFTTTFPLLVLTLMLWLIWTDSVRPARTSRVVYAVRALLFVAASVLVMYRLLQAPWYYSMTFRVVMVVASLVGLLGAAYFGRKVFPRPLRPPQ